MDSRNFTNLEIDVNDSGELIKNNFQFEESIETESNKTFYTVVLLVILLILIIKKFCNLKFKKFILLKISIVKKAENKVKKNSVLVIGPSNSGKTAFFYSVSIFNSKFYLIYYWKVLIF